MTRFDTSVAVQIEAFRSTSRIEMRGGLERRERTPTVCVRVVLTKSGGVAVEKYEVRVAVLVEISGDVSAWQLRRMIRDQLLRPEPPVAEIALEVPGVEVFAQQPRQALAVEIDPARAVAKTFGNVLEGDGLDIRERPTRCRGVVGKSERWSRAGAAHARVTSYACMREREKRGAGRIVVVLKVERADERRFGAQRSQVVKKEEATAPAMSANLEARPIGREGISPLRPVAIRLNGRRIPARVVAVVEHDLSQPAKVGWLRHADRHRERVRVADSFEVSLRDRRFPTALVDRVDVDGPYILCLPLVADGVAGLIDLQFDKPLVNTVSRFGIGDAVRCIRTEQGGQSVTGESPPAYGCPCGIQ